MYLVEYLKSKYTSYRKRRESSTTVRYMFPAMLGSALLLGASITGGIDESYVYLTTDMSTVEVGELVSVEVGVSAHVPINAVDIRVDFPSDTLDVFSVDRGQSVLTIWTQDPVIKTDSVQLVGGTFKRGFIGDHEIATIKFRALKTGQYSVTAGDITFVSGDGTGTEVAAASHVSGDLSLFNFDENTTPEEIRNAVASGAATDINSDGKVTLQDISAFMGAWSNRTQIFDFNNDGRMSFKDFSIILADFFLQ